MGMHVVGRNPTAPEGKEFRVEFWSWRPIHALVAQLCPDLLDEKTIQTMASNDGAGPTEQATCDEIAARLNQWRHDHASGFVLDAGLKTTAEGRFVTVQELTDNPGLETVSPYQTSDALLRRWIAFLHHCGGFEVW
jgi:hypothetical protein